MTDNITKLFEEALVLDTETTSLDFKEAEVIEYSSASVLHIVQTVADDEYEVETQLYKPSQPLDPKISSITNISNRMVENEEPFGNDKDVVQKELDQYPYYVAHNAFYDSKVLARYDLQMPKQICTMRLAKKIYADDENVREYNLGYLRYALDIPVADDLVAHRADADVIMTGILFAVLVDKAIEMGKLDIEQELGQQILDWLDEPVIIKKMPFGKHKGKLLEEVPLDYWHWALENFDSLQESKPEFDKDFAASVEIAVTKIFENQS